MFESIHRRPRRARVLGSAISVLAVTALTTLVAPTGEANASTGQPLLALGSHGAAVRTLESDLTRVAIKTTVNGRFNKVTRQHVVQFQRRADLSTDGIVGPRTWKALTTAVSARNKKVTAKAASVDSGGAGLAGTNTSTSTNAENLTINSNGLVNIPSDAPSQVVAMLTAANKIAKLPYLWGGGHGSWAYSSAGYDCSGSVSYILHAAGLMNAANGDSSNATYTSMQFANYGAAGASTTGWMTLWVDADSHVYMHISNLWFDTGGLDTTARDRWSTYRVSPSSGFVERHPIGW